MNLDFTHNDKPRMWTVLIGENGTGKSSILQSIALAAAGTARANRLAASTLRELPSRLPEAGELRIDAVFRFTPGQPNREYPGWGGTQDPIEMHSHLSVRKGHSDFDGGSRYRGHDSPNHDQDSLEHAQGLGLRRDDPLGEARSLDLPLWFVSGYGVHRTLPEPTRRASSDWRSSTARLRSLFDAVDLMALSFARELEDSLADAFRRALNRVIENRRLFPDLVRVDLSDHGATGKHDIADRFQVTQRISNERTLGVPATALSHGFQSSLAWIADVVGHLILESREDLSPTEMQGLVLIDEIDLYLHPTWQVNLIAALRETFPKLQFVATTHSPILLSQLHQNEVVRLSTTDKGDIVANNPDFDPRLLTGTQLYSRFFDVVGLHPSELGERVHRYGFLAANPYRNDEEDLEAREILRSLREEQVDPGFDPVDRAPK